MPISRSCSEQIRFISAWRSTPSAPVSSWPRKKLRQTLSSSTIASVWWTVAMPALMASRGEVRVVAEPSISMVPEVG